MALYSLRGNSNTYWVPALTITGGKVSKAAIKLGQELGDAVTSLQGFEPQSSKINVPIQKKFAEVQIEGPQTFQDAVLTIAEDNGNGTDADALQRQAALKTLVKGAEGYIVMLRGSTDVTVGKTAWVMAGTVGSVVPGWGFDASAATTAVNINPSTDLIPYEIAA